MQLNVNLLLWQLFGTQVEYSNLEERPNSKLKLTLSYVLRPCAPGSLTLSLTNLFFRILIASIMEEYNRGAWEEIIERCESVGVDAFEINFSCPHGMPERKMGAAMGQDPELLTEVCGWINAKATVPVWAKMTPNITDITVVRRRTYLSNMEFLFRNLFA